LKPRYTRPDANQPELVKALEKIPGLGVLDMHDCGVPNFPDLILGWQNVNYFVELKTEKGKPSTGQVLFSITWPGQYALCRNLDDVLKAIGVE
jgi:hypothetical protein